MEGFVAPLACGVFYTKGMDIFRNFVRYEKAGV